MANKFKSTPAEEKTNEQVADTSDEIVLDSANPIVDGDDTATGDGSSDTAGEESTAEEPAQAEVLTTPEPEVKEDDKPDTVVEEPTVEKPELFIPTPKLDTDTSPEIMLPSSTPSAVVGRMNTTLADYVTGMAANRVMTPEAAAQYQTRLWRAINVVIHASSNSDFVVGMGLVLDTMEENITGVFSDRYAFRGWECLILPKSERLEFENLLRLFLNLAPKATRPQIMQQCDLNVALAYTTREESRERLITYIKKITG